MQPNHTQPAGLSPFLWIVENIWIKALGRFLVTRGWLVLLGWMLIVYLLANFVLPEIQPLWASLYLLHPLLWLSLGGLGIGLFRAMKTTFPVDKALMVYAGLIGAAQIAVFLLMGLFQGFGYTPYARRLDHVLLNFWYFGSLLVGIELGRWSFVNLLKQRGTLLGLGLTIVLLTLLQMPASAFGALNDMPSIFHFVGRRLLPGLSENFLSTYLVLIGGPLAPMAYSGTRLTFELLSPILPNLDWPFIAFGGTLVPILGVLVLSEFNRAGLAKVEEELPAHKSGGMNFWVVLAILAVSLLWFNAGFFGVRPYLVSGVSMQPTYSAGDVVIVLQVPKETIQVGDVILFRHNKVAIMHRVVAIQEQNGQRVFITKGDNNNTLDEPVTAEEYGGKAVMRIPKVGWVAILFRKVLAWAF